jgi:hypothetical protein
VLEQENTCLPMTWFCLTPFRGEELTINVQMQKRLKNASFIKDEVTDQKLE